MMLSMFISTSAIVVDVNFAEKEEILYFLVSFSTPPLSAPLLAHPAAHSGRSGCLLAARVCAQTEEA